MARPSTAHVVDDASKSTAMWHLGGQAAADAWSNAPGPAFVNYGEKLLAKPAALTAPGTHNSASLPRLVGHAACDALIDP